MSNDRSEQLEMEVKTLLRGLRQEKLEPSPYLKTRVMAQVREASVPRLSLSALFRGVAVASTLVIAAVVGLWQFSSPDESFQASAHQPVAVRLDIKDLQNQKISRASVELPKGVQFFSKRFPKIQEQDVLQLSFNEEQANPMPAALPIVIQAGEAGMKSVKVRFFNQDNRMVAEKTLKIRFNVGRQA